MVMKKYLGRGSNCENEDYFSSMAGDLLRGVENKFSKLDDAKERAPLVELSARIEKINREVGNMWWELERSGELGISDILLGFR